MDYEIDTNVSSLDDDSLTTGEASGSGYAAEGSSLIGEDSSSYQSGPSSKRTKVTVSSGSQRKPTGRFRTWWKLPEHIILSKRGNTFAYCKLCVSDFSIAHGGLNDKKRHVEGAKHKSKLKDISTNSTFTSFFGGQRRVHEKSVISAELMMAQFILPSITYHLKQLITSQHCFPSCSRIPK